MSCQTCGNTSVTSTTTCVKCNNSCLPSSCNPCSDVPVATPMTLCDPPGAWCTDGCVDTTKPECVIYRGPHLGGLDIQDGQPLSVALANINRMLVNLAKESSAVPSFTFTVVCSNSEDNILSLTLLKKDGLSQIVNSIQFNNAFALLDHLQVIDPNWTFTAPNVFSLVSTSTWEMEVGCPD